MVGRPLFAEVPLVVSALALLSLLLVALAVLAHISHGLGGSDVQTDRYGENLQRRARQTARASAQHRRALLRSAERLGGLSEETKAIIASLDAERERETGK